MIFYCLIPFSLLYWRKSKDNGRVLLKKPVLNCRMDDDIIKSQEAHYAATTASHTPKGTDFSDIPQVTLLYITEYDALHNGQMIIYVKRCSISKKRKGVLEKCAKR